MFGSSRCHRWVPCYQTQVAILHRCDADGRNVHPISANVEHDNTPAILPDGRILYMRWEYVDRSELCFHHLWTMNPDGTGQMVYFGNHFPGIAMLDAKPIPGSNKVVAIFSPGHGKKQHAGAVAIVSPNSGPDNRGSAHTLTKGRDFRDPYPLADGRFLVARGPSLLRMDGEGNTQTLYTLPDAHKGMWLHEPQPLRPRPRERVVPDHTGGPQETGRLVLVDVLHGRSMKGVRPAEVKKLLVLEVLPKPVGFGGVPHALSWWGTLNLERVLGTVPVEPDGSACLDVPALRCLFFVALDERDLAVKRMQNFLTVMPGETVSCAGCHEPRTETTPAASSSSGLQALRRPPSRIEPVAGVPDVLDFPRDIQPILDRHCVRCHDDRRRDGGVTLSGDRGPIYSHSFWTLLARGETSDGQNGLGNRPPRTIGSSASPLMKKLDGSHHGARLSPLEATTLRLWIESGAAYAGTYAALGTGNLYAGRVFLNFTPRARLDRVLKPRCGGCHRGDLELQAKPVLGPKHLRTLRPRDVRLSEDMLYGLTRPERSLALLAPLAPEAGGYGSCKALADAGKPGARAPIFRDTTDPDYKKLLAVIQDMKRQLETNRRFDMPGFRPGQHYVREMQRYGILPAAVSPSSPLDPYAIDQAYWRSLWVR